MNAPVIIHRPLDYYLTKWHLALVRKDPLLAETHGSRIYKVIRADGSPAILKHLKEGDHVDETLGGAMMAWYGDDCAAAIYCYDDGAQLMEYLDGPQLLDLYDVIGEEEATEIIAGAVMRMHRARDEAPPEGLSTLDQRFDMLYGQAAHDEGEGLETIFTRAAALARRLNADRAARIVPLHGDLHHENIRESAAHGWKVIDPKGLIGAVEYEVSNIYCNPPLRPDVTLSEERILGITRGFAAVTGYNEERMLGYGAVHAALSSLWSIDMGEPKDARGRLAVSERIFAVLDYH